MKKTKKIVAYISLKDDNALAIAKYYSDAGADEILAVGFSDSEEAFHKAMEVLDEIARVVDIPMIAGDKIECVEDVKKLFCAGASKVILNYTKQSNVDMTQEVAKCFGKEKIVVSVDNIQIIANNKTLIENFADEIIFFNPENETVLEEAVKQVEIPVLPVWNFEQKEKISMNFVESTLQWSDFKLNSDGMIPVIVQDDVTDEVLMLAYMNEEAFNHTVATGRMTYYSRSRNELWVKGLTSGHFQYVKSLTADCDVDTILARVSQVGAACHTGRRSCFFNKLVEKKEQ